METKRIVIVVRHGSHDKDSGENGSLDDWGKIASEELANNIKEEIKKFKTPKLQIWSSKKPRAKETADIIQKKINGDLNVLTFEELGKINNSNLKWIEEKVTETEKNIQIIIIITHANYIMDINTKFAFNGESGYAANASGFIIEWEESPKLIKPISFRKTI